MLFSCCTNFLPCDNKSLPYFCVDFYLRPPRGGRQVLLWFVAALMEFLSTPSARRATRTVIAARTSRTDFYPRPPRGGRLRVHAPGEQHIDHFYPRPPRGGRRGRCMESHRVLSDFYPRPPRGGRLRRFSLPPPARAISIHALREEGDSLSDATITNSFNFYPRPPRGGRHTDRVGEDAVNLFLSTPSARRAT